MIELPLRDPILQFTLLVTVALIVQQTVARVHLPGLLGLLLVGVAPGPGGAGVLPQQPVVALFGEIGLIYVMFVAGIEIDLDTAAEHRGEVIGFGVAAFVFTAVPAFAAAMLLGMAPVAAILFGALLSSHTLLAYPILLRLGLLRRRAVVTAVGGTLVTDTLALVTLAVVIGLSGADAAPLAGFLPLLLLAALAAGALSVVPRIARRFFVRNDVSRAEKALFALAVLLLLATAADVTGTDDILGAFIAGVSLNRVLAEHRELREHLEFAGRMLFIPFFFVWTGTMLEIDVLIGSPAVWIPAGVMLGILVFGKFSAAWSAGALFGYPPRERVLMAGLALPQAAATLAITVTARELGLFTVELVDAVILVIFVTCLAGPILVDRIGRRVAAGARREADTPMHRPHDVEPST